MKRSAAFEDSDRPACRARRDDNAPQPNEAAKATDIPRATQDLVEISTSNVLRDPAITAFDPDVEAKLQEALKEVIEKKRNLFITGPAGSGKSYLIRKLITGLRMHKHKVGLVAPTGTAAINVGGQTIHSLFGLDAITARQSKRDVMLIAERSRYIKARLGGLTVLIVDEISMVSNEFFERIGFMAQQARGIDKPFGGLRVIAMGDFAQLPPVKGQENCIGCGAHRSLTQRLWTCSTDDCSSRGAVQHHDKWAFCSGQWRGLKFVPIVLEKVLRQADEKFADIIMTMWLGNSLSLQQESLLKARRAIDQPALRLFSTRARVDDFNKKQRRALTSPRVQYICQDRFVLHPNHQKYPHISHLTQTVAPHNALACLRDHRWSEALDLRVGMPVVLLHNLSLPEGLGNGSIGVIVGFEQWDPASVRSSGGDPYDFGHSFEGPDGPVTDGMTPVLEGGQPWYKHGGVRTFWMHNGASAVPLVKFACGVTKLVTPQCDVDGISYEGKLSLKMRVQIPLMAAWASTVHRAQGMSLERVIVDLESSFEPGMQYVAISRARTLDGLQINGLGRGSMDMMAPEVRQFLRTILPQHLVSRMT